MAEPIIFFLLSNVLFNRIIIPINKNKAKVLEYSKNPDILPFVKKKASGKKGTILNNTDKTIIIIPDNGIAFNIFFICIGLYCIIIIVNVINVENFKNPKKAIPLSTAYTQVAKYPKTISKIDKLDIFT